MASFSSSNDLTTSIVAEWLPDAAAKRIRLQKKKLLMIRIATLAIAIQLLLLPLVAAQSPNQPTESDSRPSGPPNIIYILADV